MHEGESPVTWHVHVHRLGQVTHTLNIEQVTKETNKKSHVYTLRLRASSPVRLAVLMEPGNVPSKYIPYSVCNNTSNDRTVKYRRINKRLLRKLTILLAEQKLWRLHQKCNKVLEAIAQSKITHAWLASLKHLRNTPAPKCTITKAIPMLLLSAMLSEAYLGNNVTEYTNYICTYKKIFQCISGRHPYDLVNVCQDSTNKAWGTLAIVLADDQL